MSHQANPRGALDAILAAGHEAHSACRSRELSGTAQASSRPRARVTLNRGAVMLLARVLAHRPSHGPPVIQLVACTANSAALSTASALAQACAILVGRTLLVDVDEPSSCLLLPSESADPVPDAVVAGLYRARIGSAIADADLLYGAARQQALEALAKPFRALVVHASRPCSAAALAMAPLCCCSVLVVEAGRTPLTMVQAAAASLVAAGGNVVGTVLAAAPFDGVGGQN